MKVLSKRNVYMMGVYFPADRTVEVPDLFEKEVKKNPFMEIVGGPAKKTRARAVEPKETGSSEG